MSLHEILIVQVLQVSVSSAAGLGRHHCRFALSMSVCCCSSASAAFYITRQTGSPQCQFAFTMSVCASHWPAYSCLHSPPLHAGPRNMAALSVGLRHWVCMLPSACILPLGQVAGQPLESICAHCVDLCLTRRPASTLAFRCAAALLRKSTD